MRKPTVVMGLLGWSNKRSGVEFYRYDKKIIPRHGSEWGELLALEDAVAGKEGSPVIVVVFPRNSDALARDALAEIKALVNADD